MRYQGVTTVLGALAALGLHGSIVMASIEPAQSIEPWLPEPDFVAPAAPIPLAPTPMRQVQPEPIPLPAVVIPAAATALVARLAMKKRRRRARVLR